MIKYHVVYQEIYEDAETISFESIEDMRKWIDEEAVYVVAIYKGVEIE